MVKAAGSLRSSALLPLQEFHLSASEQKILQEIEFLVIKITYKEVVTEDGELMVTASPTEVVPPSFDTAVKSYQIREGMGVTFHCRMAGTPLPKVTTARRRGVAVARAACFTALCPSSDHLVQRRPADQTWRSLSDGVPEGWPGQLSDTGGSAGG